MNETQQIYPEPVAGLMRLGDVRNDREWRDYLALGFTEEHVPDLCRMILDRDLFWADSDSDEVWSAIHAWRTLGQLRAESAVPCLIELLGRVDEYNDDWTFEDLPKIFGYIGQAAIKPLRDFLANGDYGEWSHTAAGNALVDIGRRHPDLRTDCVVILGRQLEQFAKQKDSLNAALIADVVDLQGVEAAPVIEQAFAAGKVDLMVQGDWEEVQITLGLLEERITPPPDYRALMAAQMGFDPDELLGNLVTTTQERIQVKAERQAAARKKAQAKAKRKQAKQSRKKQRKRK